MSINNHLRKAALRGVKTGVDKAFSQFEDKVVSSPKKANAKESQLLNKVTDFLDNVSVSAEEKEQRIKEEEARKESEKAQKKTPEDEIHEALDRIALIGASLEEDQQHQLINDLSLLFSKSNAYRREHSSWIMRLYGNKRD